MHAKRENQSSKNENESMNESIYIKDIGPLRHIELDDIKPLTIIIGESASGKSTLMKILAQFRYFYKMAVISSWLKNANVKGTYFENEVSEYWKRAGLEEMLKPSSSVLYRVKVNGNSYELSYKNGILSAFPVIPNEDLQFFKISFISENRSVIPDWSKNGASNAGFGAKLGFYFHETFHDFNKATDMLQDIPLEHLAMRLQVTKEGGKKRYTIKPDDGSYTPMKLENASSGVQTSSSLVTISQYMAHHFSFKDAFKRATFDFLYNSDRLEEFNSSFDISKMKRWVHLHAEEAELCLFPDAQRALVDALVKICFINHEEDRQLTLMVTTHSPYIINHLNVMLRRHRYHSEKPGIESEKLGVFRIKDGTLQDLVGRDMHTGEVVINTLDMSETMRDIYQEYMALTGTEDRKL